jgi:hypothetical protein
MPAAWLSYMQLYEYKLMTICPSEYQGYLQTFIDRVVSSGTFESVMYKALSQN